MLINNTDEFKEYIPANITLQWEDIRPKVRLVEREIIKRIFSAAVYTRLTTTAEPTAQETELKDLLSEAVAHLALLEYLAFGQVQISSSGVQIASNEQMKTAFEWQIDDLRTTCSRQGWAAIESALEYCESLPDGDLKTAYLTSQAHTDTQEQLLPNLKTFETFVSLHHSRILFNKLTPIRIQQQEEVISPALGEALWAKVLTHKEEEDEAKKAALTKAHRLASRALAYATIGEGFQDIFMILSDNGPLIIEGMQSRLAKAVKSTSEQFVESVATIYRSRAAGALRELIEYCQAQSTVLTEYADSPNFISEADLTDNQDLIPRNDPDWGIAFF